MSKKSGRNAGGLILATCMVVILAACGGGDSGPSGDAEVNGAKERELTIGFAMPVLANPFWRKEADFANFAAEELGNVEVIVTDADDDEGKQLEQVESLISQGVDGIIASPVTEAVGPALLRAAENAGIPMVFAERSPGVRPEDYEGDAYVGFVGADGAAGAKQAAKQLYDAGARTIVAMAGTKGSSVADERVGGLKEFADENPDFEILQVEFGAELQADGLKVAENFLSAYPGPEFDGIWAYNDEGALGSVKAMDEAGAGDVAITGFDGTAEATQAIIDGTMLATAGGQFVDGGLALVMLYDVINGHEPAERYIEMPLLVITPENAEAYKEQFVDDLPPYDIRQLSQAFNSSASTDDYEIAIR